MTNPTQKQKNNCISYFKGQGIYAYEHNGRIFIDFEERDICVEISADEIIERAELFQIENN